MFERDLYTSMYNNLWVMVALFVIGTPLGMLIAYILDKGLKGSALYQSIFYTPVVLSLAVVGFIWKSVMYSPGQGLLNTVLGRTETGNQIVIHEVFEDADALAFHLTGTAAQFFPQLVEFATPGPFIFRGDIPEELKAAAYGMNMGAIFTGDWTGFERE